MPILNKILAGPPETSQRASKLTFEMYKMWFPYLQNPCYLHQRNEFCLNTVRQVLGKFCQQGFINPKFLQFLLRREQLKIKINLNTEKSTYMQKLIPSSILAGTTVRALLEHAPGLFRQQESSSLLSFQLVAKFYLALLS